MARRKKGRPIHGWVILDKPLGMTSTQAVGLVKRLYDAQKAGHAGTLDPLATGILPIALGEATKTVSFAVDGEKAYRFTVRWGSETNTDDAEGSITETSEQRPRMDEIEALLPSFMGEIQQVPPQFSAIKIDGERAYDLARDGETVALEARTVVIEDLRIVDMPDSETTVFEAECGKGTYVRALARDMGRRLGCYGHVIALRRTQVGPFSEDEAVTKAELEAGAAEAQGDGAADGVDAAALPGSDATLHGLLLPVESVLENLLNVNVNSGDAARLKRGQPVLMRGRDAPVLSGPFFATCKGQIVALGEADRGELRPTRVFNIGGG
ncbi:MAG: tRNA pseudouridine(55) synthase TruB [Hyphomicrobiaceae bacterium]